jgi:hypothetical protein
MPDTSITIPIDELRTAAGGAVITPDDPEYEQARMVFYRNFDRRPAVIVRPESAAAVARIVSFARESSTELAVRSGGHSLAGHGVSEGGIVLDLAALKAMEVDPHARTASAQTGLTAAEYTTTAGEYGLATGFGDTGVVGIGGLTLGGGVGFLSRRYGLTIDDLLGADIVTADGDVLQVDDESHPDLFWAIRGGGGNFGVATKFTFRLHELPSIVGGMLILPATPPVIESFIAAADEAPDELSAIANIMVAPPMPFLPEEAHGKPIIVALVCYAGDADSGPRALAPFRALAKPVADLVRPMAYPEIYELGPPPPPPSHDAARSFFIEEVDATAAETIVEQVRASTAPMAVAQLRVLGGASRPRRRRTRTATGGSWWRSVRYGRTVRPHPCTSPGWTGSHERWSAASPGSTSTSSVTKARRGCARRTRAKRGTG